jgi:hypothetical protein
VQLCDRGLGRECPAVGPLGDHRIERVARGHDAGGERDLPAGEAVGIAPTVPALVRGANRRRQTPKPLRPQQDLRAAIGVGSYDVPLVRL